MTKLISKWSDCSGRGYEAYERRHYNRAFEGRVERRKKEPNGKWRALYKIAAGWTLISDNHSSWEEAAYAVEEHVRSQLQEELEIWS